MNDIKYLHVELPSDMKYYFSNKVKFYDLKVQDVVQTCIQMFLDGDLDDVFNIPKD